MNESAGCDRSAGAVAVVALPAAFVFDDPEQPTTLNTQLRLGEVVAVLGEATHAGVAWAKVRFVWGVEGEEVVGTDVGWVQREALRAEEAEGGDALRYVGRSGASSLRFSALGLGVGGGVDADAAVERARDSGGGVTWLQVSAMSAHLYAVASRKGGPAACVLPCEAWVAGVARFTGDAVSGSDRNGWWEVVLPDGRALWVQQGDVAEGGLPALSAEGSVAEAARMVGRPYVWSGTTSFGYDCSGLTQMLARRRGVGLPHSAKRQFAEVFPRLERVGEDRSIAEVDSVPRPGEGETTPAWSQLAEDARQRWAGVLRAGDFVYFAMGGKRVDHVGVWAGGEPGGASGAVVGGTVAGASGKTSGGGKTSGAGVMLHASSGNPPMTKRELLWGGSFAARMTGVRRVV